MNEGTPVIIKKKKVHGHAAHHGGSWKVAYADFVTAMMAFFMVMWIMGLSDQTRAQIQGYFNDPLGFTKNQPKSTQVIRIPGSPNSRPGNSNVAGNTQVKTEQVAARHLESEVQKAVEAEAKKSPELRAQIEGIEISLTGEGLQIEFIEKGNVFFELGSAKIRPQAKPVIARIAAVLAKSKHPLSIDGHTDARPYLGGPAGYDNWDLSADRANSMRRELTADGILQNRFLQIRGNASRKLKRPEDPYHFSNRRVCVLLPYQSDPQEPEHFSVPGALEKPVNVAPVPPRK